MIKHLSHRVESDAVPDSRVEVIAERPSRFELLHAVVFVFGFFVSAAGVFVSSGTLMVLGGPCLIVSAALSWLGMRFSMRGVVGNMMRAVLGPIPLLRMHLRNTAWLVIGIALTLWGVSKLTKTPHNEDGFYAPAHLSQSK